MKDKQELLNKLFKQQLTELKKKCFKYQHNTRFLEHKLEIETKYMRDLGTAGLYEKVEGKHKYDFTHKIIIDNGTIDQYLNYKRGRYIRSKTYFKNQLKGVIRHELVHAFVEEHYGGLIDIGGVANDASPIFLSILYWLGGSSNHGCVRAFKKTELYKKIYEFKTFTEIDTYLTILLLDYAKVARKNKEFVLINNNIVYNAFFFGERNASLESYRQVRKEFLTKTNSELKSIEANVFKIGCCTMPWAIDDLVSKKRFGSFEKYEYSKIAVNSENNTVKTVYKVAVGM